MSEMSFEDAAAALGDAIDTDNGSTPLPESPAPAEQAPPAPTTPEGESAPVQPHWSQEQDRDINGRFTVPESQQPEPVQDTPDLFEGGTVNPDELIAQNPELAPFVKQLQGEWTRKTQALAEQRRQFDGIDPAQAREAMELYTALQDPQYLMEFHQELSTALQAQGLSPAQADAEAARHMDAASGQQSGTTGNSLDALRNDPELAPVANEITQLRQQLESMQAEQKQEREAQEWAQYQMALAGEMMRQESVLRDQGFKEQDLNVVRDLAGAHDGNMLKAAEAYKALRSEVISEYLGQKQSVEPGVGPVPGDGNTSEVPTVPETLEEAHKAAAEYLRGAEIDTVL